MRCERLSSTIRSEDCAKRYRGAVRGAHHLEVCRGCPVGALLAGPTKPAKGGFRVVGDLPPDKFGRHRWTIRCGCGTEKVLRRRTTSQYMPSRCMKCQKAERLGRAFKPMTAAAI